MLSLQNEVILPHTETTLFLEGQFNLKLIGDCLKNSGYIGTVQPLPHKPDMFFEIGSLVQVLRVLDIGGDAIQVLIKGCIRFEIVCFLKEDTPYYKADVSYTKYLADLEKTDVAHFGRNRLLQNLRKILNAMDLLALDWDVLDQCTHEHLIYRLTQICPLSSVQKQHILETESVSAQSFFLSQCMEDFFYNLKTQ